MLDLAPGRPRARARLLRAVTAVLAVLGAGLFLVAGAPDASAHAVTSSITLTVEGEGSAVAITAEVRYADHDTVTGETVVGVAWSPATQQVVPLSLSPVPGKDGLWEVRTHLAPGPWRVEVDAVEVTRGLQSVGFTVGTSGAPSSVVSPSPLPAGIPVPLGPAQTDAAGPRASPATAASTSTVVLAGALVVVGAAVPVVVLRRRRAAEQGVLGDGSPHEL